MSESTDFSDRTVSAYNKFTFVGSITVLILTLGISESSSFFGFSFEKQAPRILETWLFLASTILGINYFLRLGDEFSVLSKSKQRLEAVNTELENEISRTMSVAEQCKPVLNRISEIIDSINQTPSPDPGLTDFLRKVEEFPNFDEPSEFIQLLSDQKKRFLSEYDSGSLYQVKSQDFQDAVNNFKHENKYIVENLKESSKTISSVKKEIADINLNSYDKKSYPWIVSIRQFLIDIMVPFILLISILLSFIWYGETKPLIWLIDSPIWTLTFFGILAALGAFFLFRYFRKF